MSPSRPSVHYARETDLDPREFAEVLGDSGLGAIRPLADPDRIQRMVTGANLVITARLDAPDRRLVGVARGICDFSWCCYIAELAVSRSAQGLGVGQGLLDKARLEIGPKVSLFLAAVPESVSFYERIGMPRLADAFCFRREY